MSNISRALIDALLPEGIPWNIEKNGDFDLFLNGISLGIEDTLQYLSRLDSIRNPFTIPIELLSDLEKEYGIITQDTLSEETRRMQLAVKIYEPAGTGSPDNLQTALNNAGFNVLVHPNDPAIDPAILLDQAFQVVIGDPLNAFIGDPEAYFGRAGGYLLVNGPIITRSPAYLGLGDTLNGFIGDPATTMGFFWSLQGEEKIYNIPTDPDTWPFIFFVGGPAIRGGGGQLISIEAGEVPAERKSEFEEIILTYKPIYTWAGIIISYI